MDNADADAGCAQNLATLCASRVTTLVVEDKEVDKEADEVADWVADKVADQGMQGP